MRIPHVLLATASLATAVALVATAADASASVPTRSKLASTLLKQSDVPSGWKSYPTPSTTTSANSGAIPTSMAHCLGLSAATAKPKAFAVSAYFLKGSNSVASTASSYSSATALRKDLAAVRSKKYGPCYESFIKSEFTKNHFTVTKASVHVHNPYQGAAHGVVREINIVITGSIQGQKITQSLSQVIVSGDHTIGDVAASAPSATAFPVSLLHSAGNAVAKRIARL